MTRRSKLGLIALALAVAAVAFAVARSGGGDDAERAAPVPAQPAAEAVTTEAGTTEATTEEVEAETLPAETTAPETQAVAPSPPPKPPVVRTRGGKPVGDLRKLRVHRGEIVSFVVTSDIPEEVHVHGYDLSKDVGPGAPARFRFRAELEGIFEVELEGAGEQIIELRVEP